MTLEKVGGLPRLRVEVDKAQDAALAARSDGLRGSFQLLYVVHTTRTGAELGRYESPELTLNTVQKFLRRFGRFLCEDYLNDSARDWSEVRTIRVIRRWHRQRTIHQTTELIVR